MKRKLWITIFGTDGGNMEGGQLCNLNNMAVICEQSHYCLVQVSECPSNKPYEEGDCLGRQRWFLSFLGILLLPYIQGKAALEGPGIRKPSVPSQHWVQRLGGGPCAVKIKKFVLILSFCQSLSFTLPNATCLPAPRSLFLKDTLVSEPSWKGLLSVYLSCVCMCLSVLGMWAAALCLLIKPACASVPN